MSNEELIRKTDDAIAELVQQKVELKKAYNYYNGIRDAEQYRYLEENFGIGNPTSVEFTPLIKKHIDALVGEFLGVPILPKVTCKDKETINNINRDKQLYINKEIYQYLQNKLKNDILSFLGGQDFKDTNIEQQLNKLKEDLETDFTSEYEIAAQNVIEYLMQNRYTDITTNLRHLLLDLLIAGYCLFRCKPSVGNQNVSIEVLDPLNTFIDRNPESVYIRDSYRVVVRKWMNKQQILNKYGKDLKKEDLESIKTKWKEHYQNRGSYYVHAHPHDIIPPSDGHGLDWGKEVQFGEPDYNDYYYWGDNEVLPVYEVEWIEVDKKFVMQRYETIRIADDIYILKGKNENVIRSKDNPTYCGLSVNGIYFTNRSHKPYSLMLACTHLQDKYDLLLFIRDTILANSGTIGDYVDISMLPSWLGQTPLERLQKYQAYKKNGIAPIDSAQEGRILAGVGQANTWMTGYDDTPKVQAIQAIQLAIDSLEQTVSSITGVFRERLQGIEQRDAVTNVKQGVQNSFIITKQYYQQMNLVVEEMFLDALNIAKVVYKHGLTGTLILGEKQQKIFTALPEFFTVTDYDIHVTTSDQVIKDLEQIKALIPEFIKSQALAPEIIFEALTAKSLPELKRAALLAMKKQKEENNQMQQLQQQGEQLQQQLQEAQKQLQQAQSKIEQLNEQKLQIESQRMQSDAKVAWYKAQTEREWKKRDMDNDEKRVQIELLQLTDGNPYNDKVRQG